MRLLPDVEIAGLMATGEIAGGEEIHEALRQHIGAVKSEAHRATGVRPISIALPRTAAFSNPRRLLRLGPSVDQCRPG